MTAKRQGGFWRLMTLFFRALRLRCPACGKGQIFRGWFTMNDQCSECGRPFQRGPGFFLGSIYFNYSVTAILVIAIYFLVFVSGALTDRQVLVALTTFVFLFPLWFFRYARSLWIAFDEIWDPTTNPPNN